MHDNYLTNSGNVLMGNIYNPIQQFVACKQAHNDNIKSTFVLTIQILTQSSAQSSYQYHISK